jgi:hypothetical protein
MIPLILHSTRYCRSALASPAKEQTRRRLERCVLYPSVDADRLFCFETFQLALSREAVETQVTDGKVRVMVPLLTVSSLKLERDLILGSRRWWR